MKGILMRLVPLVLVASAVAFGETTPREALLVLSKGDHTIAIVDPSSLKVVGKAPVGEDPHEVIASADGKFAYVSNYGFGSYNTLTVIDLIAQKRVSTIDLGALRGPHGLDFAGGKVWFTAEAAKAIGSYDPAKNLVDWIMGTGQDRTHMLVVSDDLKRIYTTNVSSATVSVIERVTRQRPRDDKKGPPPAPQGGPARPPTGPPATGGMDWQQTVIAVGKGAEGFDIGPGGRELWAANAQDGTISIVDVASKKVTSTLEANVPGANRLKFTPDGKLVFVSSLGGAGLVILDAASHKEVKRLPTPRGASGLQMQPDGSRAYLSCTGENYVAVINLKTLEMIGRIDAGPQPDGLAWSVLK
jgi:DNA-binding beta-propeller fold protein YncE